MLQEVYLNIPIFSKKTKNQIKYQPKQISNTENEEVVLPESGIIFLISNANLRPLWLEQKVSQLLLSLTQFLPCAL